MECRAYLTGLLMAIVRTMAFILIEMESAEGFEQRLPPHFRASFDPWPKNRL